jgi:release factor glutamine methyltransferase
VGHKEFYGLDLACTRAALIPRPETELLVECAIAWSRRRSRPSLVDVGTGNGAIAVALAVDLPEAPIIAIDASRPALNLARRNATAHGVQNRVTFLQGDLLASFRGRFDGIVANLPYIPSLTYAKLPPEIREHEPERALRAGVRGTSVIERLLEQAPRLLMPGGMLLAEHSWNQGRRLRDAARSAFPDAAIETKRDLAGRERMLVIQTP